MASTRERGNREGRRGVGQAATVGFEYVDIDEDMVLVRFDLHSSRGESTTDGQPTFLTRLLRRRKESRTRQSSGVSLRDQRASARAPLHVKVERQGGRSVAIGRAENISAGGVFVATNLDVKVGEHIRLSFRLPRSSEVVAVDAEVRWRRTSRTPGGANRSGMGVRFVGLGPSASAAIGRFLGRR